MSEYSIILFGLVALFAGILTTVYAIRKNEIASAQWMVLALIATALALPLTWISIPGLGIDKYVVRLVGDWQQDGEIRLRFGKGKYDFIQLQKTNYAVDWPDQSWHELEIIATGERNPASKSSEVWLTEARDGSGVIIPLDTFQYEEGWHFEDQALISIGGSSSVLRWSGPLSSVALNFVSHEWSGKVIVRWDGIEQLIDLYWGISSQPHVVVLGLQEWQAELPSFFYENLHLHFNQSEAFVIRRLQIGEQILEGNDLFEQLQTSQADIELKDGVVKITPKTSSFEILVKGGYGSSPGRLSLSLLSLFLVWFFPLLMGLILFGRSFLSKVSIQDNSSQEENQQRITRANLTAIVSIFCLLVIISMYLVYAIPQSDSSVSYSEAIGQKSPNPFTPQLWAIGRDGEVHAVYEPGITYLYRFLHRVGSFLDDRFKLSSNSWTFSLAFVELPHLLVLPLTGCLLFALFRKMQVKLKLAVLLSTLGLLSTIIPIYCSPYSREGLGIVPIIAAFYFAFISYRGDRRRRLLFLFLSGFFAGITVLIKVTSGIIAFPLILYVLLKEIENTRGRWIGHFTALAVVGLGMLPSVGLLLLDRWIVFGIIGVLPFEMTRTYTENLSASIYRSIYGLLFSPGVGLFWYNPLLWLVIPGFHSFLKLFKNESIFFILHIIGLLLLLSPLTWWDGFPSWGPRYLLAIVPWGLLVVGVWLNTKGKKMLVTFSLIAAGIMVQLPMLLMSWDIFKFFNSSIWKESDWTGVLRIFDPYFSPIIVTWKILLAKLTYGKWFGNQILFLPDGNKLVDFGAFARPPMAFWYTIVNHEWGGLWGYIVFSFLGIAFSLYGLYWSFREENRQSTQPPIEEQPNQDIICANNEN